MRTTRTDRCAAEGGKARLSLLVALAGILLAVTVAVLEVWATPPGWLLPARRQTVGVLHWAKDNWLSTAALSTAVGVVGVLTPFLLRWLDHRRPMQAADQAQDTPQQRAVMLRRVRYKWITGVLEPSLAPAARLVLGLERRPDILNLGGRAVRRPGRPPEPLPANTPISEVFDKVGGGLLILGAPGAGKTTALLQLCDQLLDRAEHDLEQPMPLVMNLASWAGQRLPLGVWLVEELSRGYQVPRRIAAHWVEQEALVLLLDGLDEVAEAHRAACAEAVNAWRRDHGLVPLVVCCRTQELQTIAVSLRFEEAVELQPPTDAEVDRYLSYLEATGTSIGDVRAALASDQDLRRLLRSPLLLHVIALAYHGRPASALSAHGTLQQRQGWLWQAYVERMFEQRPLDPGCGYTQEQALEWLAWLARALRSRDQSEFHLDRLTPEWLPTPVQQRARVMTRLAVGLPFGLAIGSAFGLMNSAVALNFGLVGGLAFGLAAGLAMAPIAGLVFGLAGVLKDRSKPAQPARWPFWKRRAQLIRGQALAAPDESAVPNEGARRAQNASVAAAFGLAVGFGGGLSGGLSRGMAFGLSVALAIGLAGGLGLALTYGQAGGQPVSVEPTEQVRWSWPAFHAGLARWLAIGLASALVFGLLFGLTVDLVSGLITAFVSGLTIALVFGLLAGISAGLRDERVVPNEGIRRSAQHALVVGLSAGLIAALTGWLGYGLLFGLTGGLSAGLGFGLTVAAAIAIVFGGVACVQHYVVRAWLVRGRIAPWRYGTFLEAMAQRLLLRRSGGAYLFIHRLLRDYMSDANPDRTEAAPPLASDGARRSAPGSLALPSDYLSDGR